GLEKSLRHCVVYADPLKRSINLSVTSRRPSDASIFHHQISEVIKEIRCANERQSSTLRSIVESTTQTTGFLAKQKRKERALVLRYGGRQGGQHVESNRVKRVDTLEESFKISFGLKLCKRRNRPSGIHIQRHCSLKVRRESTGLRHL